MSGDRLSNLSNDLLWHILSFAPAKEAASTSALARRWRSVWCSSGTVNLQWRSFMVHRFGDMRWIYQEEAIVALNAQATPVRLLTLHVQGEEDHEISHGGMYYDMSWESRREINQAVGQVISSPAASRLEELRIRVCDCRFVLEIASLACATLRVLHLGNCITTFSQVGASFQLPQLTVLRLQRCSVLHMLLNAIVDAAPLLSTLLLDRGDLCWWSCSSRCLSLSCPKLTALVLWNFDYGGNDGTYGLEFDDPMLQCFTYEGHVQRFSLKTQKSPTACLAMADVHLDVSQDVHKDCRNAEKLFWEFMSYFSSANTLKLNFDPCMHTM